jgi:hypothetical protein
MLGNSALFALHLGIPPILVEAAVLDGVLDDLIQVHREGVEGYSPEAAETFNDESYALAC